MKRIHVAAVSIFLLPLIWFGTVSMLDRDPVVSMQENRALKPRPVFSWDALWAGSYTRDLDEYYADTFPLREQLIGASGFWDSLLVINTGPLVVEGDFDLGLGENLEEIQAAQQGEPPVTAEPAPEPTPSPAAQVSPTPSPTVTEAPEPSEPPELTPEPTPTATPEPTPEPNVDLEAGGYLLIGDRIMHMSYTDKDNLQKYAEMLDKFAAQMPDTQVISMAVPNSFPFYAPSAFLSQGRDQQRMIQMLGEMLNSDVLPIDTYTPIGAHRDEYLYFRSDHHWTARGAYWAYTGFCEALGFTPVALDDMETGQYEGFLGSFYRDLSKYAQSSAVKKNPDTVEYFIPLVNCTAESFSSPAMTDGKSIPVVNTKLSDEVSNKYICFTNGDQPLIRIQTDAPSERKLLVVKESYGNALIPFFVHHYSEVYVVDYRRFNGFQGQSQPTLKLPDFVSEHEITDVVFASYPYVPNAASFIKQIDKLAK